MGILVTFYSYKGGVGRTMALANIATLLAIWGKKVLVVDWDLEAPGIEHFLVAPGRDLAAAQARRGLIDLLTELSAKTSYDVPETSWKPLLLVNRVPGTDARLSLITAGARTKGYFKNVRSLDVKSFYEDKNGGHIIESLRKSWKSHFDFVLVDSRTGITDIGGICTIQLPDALAIVFTATAQSLDGAVAVAKQAAAERQKLPFDRSLVPTVPIPSRFDTQTEHKISNDWLGKFETALAPFYHQWLSGKVDRQEFLRLTKIPYTPFFSFGEELPVVSQGTKDPTGLGYAYETVAALIGNNLEHAELLLSNRDEFVQAARSSGRIPKIPLRDSQWDCVLFVGVGSGSLRVFSEEASSPSQGNAWRKYHSVIKESAREEGGDLVESDGQSFLFAFPQSERAIRCAIAVQETMAVRRPISGPSGALSARMAIHASEEGTASGVKTRNLRNVASLIASKARDGEILVSEEAVKLQMKPVDGVKFEPQREQLEVPSGDATVLMKLFRAARIVSVELTDEELEALFGQDPESRGGGGFQALLVALQEKIKDKRTLELTISDRERIARYAHDYRSGGWQGRLRKIFGRTLGSNLGRERG